MRRSSNLNNVISNTLDYLQCVNENGAISNCEGREMPRGRQTPSESAAVLSCSFTRLTSGCNGGAISFTYGTTLSLDKCIFMSCSNSVSNSSSNGGGAVFINHGALSVSSSLFISCITPSYGGGIHAYTGCSSSSVSFSAFIECEADHGGGLSTYCGPASTSYSTRIISCTTSKVGGGMYHDSNLATHTLTIRGNLFSNNRAEYINETDSYNYRGGGAFEEFRLSPYTSHYYFSFFTRNTAPNGVGQDISVVLNSLVTDNIQHCFTTTSLHSLWNLEYTGYDNWLPLGDMK